MADIRIPEGAPLKQPDIHKRRILFSLLAKAAMTDNKIADAREPWTIKIRLGYGSEVCTQKDLPMPLINDLMNAINYTMGEGAAYWECDGQTLTIGSNGYQAW